MSAQHLVNKKKPDPPTLEDAFEEIAELRKRIQRLEEVIATLKRRPRQ
jgi:division protein CdvB (Snf7/Vps24/ESCRT-III family)